MELQPEIFFILCSIVSLYVAWNVGANDVANAIGTSVGSNIISYTSAILIACCFEVLGATFAGDKVSQTLGAGLLTDEIVTDSATMLLGMFSTLMATGLWLQTATFLSLPISTTHTMVGAILGFAISAKGMNSVKWMNLLYISSFWALSPIGSAIIATLLSWIFQRHVFSDGRVTIFRSSAIALCVTTVVPFVIIFYMMPSIWIITKIIVSSVLAMLIGFSIWYYSVQTILSSSTENEIKASGYKFKKQLDLKKLGIEIKPFQEDVYEIIKAMHGASKVHMSPKELSARHTRQIAQYIFGSVQWLSVALISFVHGANDVANAMGPIVVIINIIKYGFVPEHIVIHKSLLLIGGIGIVTGIVSFGWRVVATIGGKIVPLTPVRALSAELSTSITVLIATVFGMPVSTSHSLVGSLIGISAAYQVSNVNLKVIKYIVLSWVLTTPIGMALSALIFHCLSKLLL